MKGADMMRFAIGCAAAVLVLSAGTAAASKELDSAARRAIVESLADSVAKIYVFPELADQYAAALRSHLAKGEYDAPIDANAFADRLTSDLHAVKVDKHLRVVAPNDPRGARFRAPADAAHEENADPLREMIERERVGNFGFAKLEILPGNVGLIDLRGFVPAEVAGETAAAAMNFVAHCDAIVFDLRKNGGGHPSMIQLLTSYLLDEQPRHLNDFYIREGDVTQQFYTLPQIPGSRRPNVDVFVLTSASTFSAAEEFTYNLKSMERATIVGETTGGGAHPIRPADLGYDFLVTIPFGRAVNPITGTNWEGTGVAPDLACPAADALKTAHLEALRRIASRSTDEAKKRALEWTIDDLVADAGAATPKSLAKLAGTYGVRSVTLEGARLYLQRENGPKLELRPLRANVFAVEGSSVPTRVTFQRGQGGDELVITTPDGEIGRAARS